MASPFASKVTKTIPIPFDPPHEVTLRKLSGRHLQKARDAFMAEMFRGIQERGGANVQKEMAALWDNPEAKQQIETAQTDPLAGLDKYTLARLGIERWSYDEPVSEQAVDDLDDEAVAFFATETMRLTKPALFQTKDEQEADRKNGSAS